MTGQTTGAGERPDGAAPGLLGSLRPYLPGRHIAEHLCTGSAELARRGWAWVTAEDWRTAGERLAYLGGGAYVAWYGAQIHPEVVMPTAAGAWCIAALALSPAPGCAATVDHEHDQEDEELQEDDEEDADPSPPPLDAATVARAVRQLAAAGGWQGAHLADVAAHLGHPAEEILDVLHAAGIEVAEQLKIRLPGRRQRNRQGVRVSALPPGLEEDPPHCPVTGPSGPLVGGPAEGPAAPSPPPPIEASPWEEVGR